MDQKVIESIFDSWDETIIWSCLQGVMGEIYTDAAEDAAMALLGDFAFFAGKPCEALIRLKPENRKQDFIIMVPQNEEWAEQIEKCYGERAKKVTRYAIKKEADIFDVKKLEQAALSLPEGYELKLLEEAEYHICRNNEWSKDLVSQYQNYDMYKELGLGVVVLSDGELVAGASSYSTYREGIEIEIDTREDYRRKGLAYACGAKLILECLDRGLYPSWDAQNQWSAALAEKLGYHFSHEYTAYEIMEKELHKIATDITYDGRKFIPEMNAENRKVSEQTVSTYHQFDYKRAAIEDIDQLVRTRMIVLRAANKLSDDVDMSEVEQESRAYYQRALESDEHIAYLVYDKDKFIGAGGVSFYQVMPTYHNSSGKKAYIMNMYTAPQYRRQGIAFHTLDLLVKAAKEQGVSQIGLEATDMGLPLYEKYGFKKLGNEMGM